MDYKDLVNKAINGDEQAVTQLYNSTYQTAYSIAVRTLKDENEAFDIIQDAYISAFNNLSKLENAEKFPSWLNRIVANKCKDYFKKKRPDFLADNVYSNDDGEIEIEIEDGNKMFSPQENVDYKETKRLISEMLDNLPDDQRLVLLMYYLQDMSIKEISQTLNVSENTVKSRMNYAKKKLKTEVETLEKKGTKLRSITGPSLIAFIIWMLRNESKTKEIPKFANTIKKVSKPASKINGKLVGNESAKVAGKAAKYVAANTTKKTIAGFAVKKVAIGLAAVTAVSGSGVALYVANKPNKSVSSSSIVTTLSSTKATISENITIDDEVITSSESQPVTVTSKIADTTQPTITSETTIVDDTTTTEKTTETSKTKKITTTKKTTKKKTTQAEEEYDIFDGTFSKYNGNSSSFTIPSYYDGDTVTEIGSKAFKGSKVSKVYIPSTITSISSSAFDGLWDVTLYVKKGSYAESYAKDEEFDYKIY